MVTVTDFINAGLLAAGIRMATPIVYTALGAMFSERVGIVQIGLEGVMLTSAWAGVAASYYTGYPWIGVIVAVITGGLVSAIHAIITVRYTGDQIVSGTGLNILALGFTSYMTQIIWGNRGASEGVQGIESISIPIIKDTPFIGTIIGNHSPLVYLMPIIVYASYYVLFRTPFGLRIRAVGEHPTAAETAGIDVIKIKYICVILAGMLAGLGGAFLSLSHLNLFTRGMTGGRGFIAMAAMIFGKWMPLGVFLSGLLFGFADALQIRLQSLGILPPQIILTIPYILTVAILAGFVGKAKAPSDYKPYRKE